jgi:hypothetical protein
LSSACPATVPFWNRRCTVPSIAATASELTKSSRTGLASAATSSRARLSALMRSRRDKPDPLSSTSSGMRRLRFASHASTVSVARAVVAGGGERARREREEELPRHHVVRQLVDVAHHVP